jgi:hypothetical protein
LSSPLCLLKTCLFQDTAPPRQSSLYCPKTAFAPIIIACFRQLVEDGGVVCINLPRINNHRRLTFSI